MSSSSASASVAEAPANGPGRVAPSAQPPVRLLLVTDTSVRVAGGSERFLRTLVTQLPRDRYRITLAQLLPQGPVRPGTRIDVDLDHVEVLDLPVGPVYGAAGRRAWRRLRSLVAAGGIDIVQSQHEKSDLLVALLPRGPRNALRISSRRDMGFQKSARLKQAFRVLNGRFDALIAPAQPVLETLAGEERADPARMHWIPNGVDTTLFRPLDGAQRAAARAALGLPAQALAICCPARMIPQKGHGTLLEAFAQLHARCPSARLDLVGDGPTLREVAGRISALGLDGVVRTLGLRLDVESLLPAYDIGVLSSLTEGMPNALLEMMACGLPVVATAVGGCPALVEDDASGLLVPAADPAALCAALGRLACDPALRRRFGDTARERVQRSHSSAAMVRAFDRTYQQLLACRA